MKNKKILLILSLAMIGVTGTHLMMKDNGVTMNALAKEVTYTGLNSEEWTITGPGSIANGMLSANVSKSDTVTLKSNFEFKTISNLSFDLEWEDKKKVTLSLKIGNNSIFDAQQCVNLGTYFDGWADGNKKIHAMTLKPSYLVGNTGGIVEFTLSGTGTSKYVDLSNLSITHDAIAEYNVQFNNSGVIEESLTQKVETGSYVSTDAKYNYTLPNKEGFKFVGWSTTEGGVAVDLSTYTITADTTFYALWEAVGTYTVTFYDYEGAEARLVTMNEGLLVDLAEPKPREGYEFLGWYKTSTFDEGTQVTKETVLSSDLTLYGKWQEATYVFVSFVVEGQEVSKIRTIQGHVLDTWPENPTVNGLIFVGWFDENDVEYTSASTFDSTITLIAKFEIIPVHMYNFSDSKYATVIPDVATDRVEIDETVSLITFNKKTGKSGTIDEFNFTNSMQAKAIEVTLKYNAEVTVYLAQTGNNKTRKIAVIDNEGFLHTTELEPATSGDAQIINLEAGTYRLLAFDYSSYDYFNPMYNFYGVKIDYTNRDTITSDLYMTEGVKLSNQAGYDANHNESMRFVGEIDYATVSDISSIRVDITASKMVDGLLATETVAGDYIYTVYDRVTLTDGARYDFHDDRLYFYYIVDGLNETYETLTCEASVALTNGTTYRVTSTFDYKVSFGK